MVPERLNKLGSLDVGGIEPLVFWKAIKGKILKIQLYNTFFSSVYDVFFLFLYLFLISE